LELEYGGAVNKEIIGIDGIANTKVVMEFFGIYDTEFYKKKRWLKGFKRNKMKTEKWVEIVLLGKIVCVEVAFYRIRVDVEMEITLRRRKRVDFCDLLLKLWQRRERFFQTLAYIFWTH